jgi:hypothetical protein
MLASGILFLIVILFLCVQMATRKVVIKEECCGGEWQPRIPDNPPAPPPGPNRLHT